VITLYLLWWDNGLEYEEHTLTLLGAYTSPEKRQAAEQHYGRLVDKQWPFYSEGHFCHGDVPADENLFPVHPAVTL